MNPIIFSIGKFQFRWYTALIILAFLCVSALVSIEGRKFKFNKDFLFNLIFWTVIMAFLGARIYYVIFNWSYYSKNLSEIFKIWQGGLAIHGGLIAGAITIFIYSKKYKVNPLKVFDIVAVPMLLGQAIGRWGNFFNSEAHGTITTIAKLKSLHVPNFIIKGMNIDGIYYQPTFLYESLWCLLCFLILLIVRRYRYIKTGQLTALYMILYSIGRFFIETFRTDSLMLGGFKVAQIVSFIMIIAGLILFFVCKKKSKFENLYNENLNKEIDF